MKQTGEEKNDQKETARTEAFSDGIFCVAITLLAIEMGVETKAQANNSELTKSLLLLWPKYLAYFMSFINVLLAWVGHHSLFKKIQRTDQSVMISNGILMMLVALVPFPAKTLGSYLQTDAFKAATVFYTGYFVLISLAFKLLWFAASRKRNLLVHHISAEQIRQSNSTENIGLVCNCVIFLLAFTQPWIALGGSILMWIYWLLPENFYYPAKALLSKARKA